MLTGNASRKRLRCLLSGSIGAIKESNKMDTTTFDTHQAVKAITGSGLDDTQAEAIVTTIYKAMHQGLATKSDIVPLKADVVTIKDDVVTIKDDVVALKADVVTLKDDVVALKSDMKGVNSDIVSLKGDMLVLKWMVGLVIAVEALPFLKFFFA